MYHDVLQRDGEWSSGHEGTVIGARTSREESVMQAIGVEGTVMEPLHLSMDDMRHHRLVIVKYPTGESEEFRLHHWLDQVFGEPATIKYIERTGTMKIEKVFGRLQGT